jgi:hypothetical protein
VDGKIAFDKNSRRVNVKAEARREELTGANEFQARPRASPFLFQEALRLEMIGNQTVRF